MPARIHAPSAPGSHGRTGMPAPILARLARVRGEGGRAERRATLRLARAALGLRREFEALVLAGRAASLADAAGDPEDAISARLHRVAALCLLRDGVRATTLLDEVAARVAALPASRRRRWAGPIGALRTEAHDAASPTDASLARAQAGPAAAGTGLGLRVRAVALRLAVRRGAEDASAAGAMLLDALDGAEGADAGPAARRELALGVADALRPFPAAGALVRRAHDHAVTAAFERLAELERFVLDVPEVAAPAPDDLEALEDHRVRAADAHDEFHAAVARRLASAADEGVEPAAPLAVGGELACVCAWCQRVRTRRGVWLSIQQFLPLELEGPIALTHGICDLCEASLRHQLEATEATPGA